MTKSSIIVSLLLALLIFTGCNKHVGLSGKVIYSDDKSPVPTGTVCLETDTFLARGNIRPDGTFVVGSVKQTDGMPPGKYRVSISDAQRIIGQDENGDEIYEPLIDAKFTDSATSGITIDITSTTRNFVIEVDRYVPAR